MDEATTVEEARLTPSRVAFRGIRASRETLRLFFTGFAMGTADIVPGVSGGTIAFILGIYDRLVASIKQMTGSTVRDVLRGRFRVALTTAPLPFILPLLIGIGVAAFSLANLLSWLLREHPLYVWAFFFGLVAASITVVTGRVRIWTLQGVAAFAVAAIGAYVLLGIAPVTTPETPLAVFVAGSIAICAMILPGISGSFILIILGKYDQILEAVTQRDVLTLGIFFLGALAGIALFSRLLSWLLAKQHDLMVLVLAGLMLGSLRKVWPWKETLSTRINRHGEEVPLQEANILPVTFDESLVVALLLAFAGAAIILYLNRLGTLSSQSR
jgi:putative membrane protein